MQPATDRRKSTADRYLPRRFGTVSRERFYRDRGRRYLGRIAGEPSDQQLALVQSMTRLEWAALVAEGNGSLPALRDAREHRRLFQRLLADFERSLVPAAEPRAPSIDEINARIISAREASA